MAGYLDRITRKRSQGLRDDLRGDLAGAGYTDAHHTNTQASFRSKQRLNTDASFKLRDFWEQPDWENPNAVPNSLGSGQEPTAYLENMPRAQARAIVAIQDTLAKSRLGRKMLDVAHRGQVQFGFVTLPFDDVVAGYLNRQRQVIYNINGCADNGQSASDFIANAAVDTAHELGHTMQDKAVASSFDVYDYTIDHKDRLLSIRHFEAGATAASIQVAWDVAEAGDDSLWRVISTEGPDIGAANAFAEMAANDPSSVRDGRARRVAHDSWFKSPTRLAAYDDSLTVSYRQILTCLAEQQAAGFPREDARQLAERIGGQRLDSDRLEAAAEMPDGINHLRLAGQADVRDAGYADSGNDRIREQVAFLDGIALKFRRGETVTPDMLDGYDAISARYDGTSQAQDRSIGAIGEGVPGEPDDPFDRMSKRNLLGKWRSDRSQERGPAADTAPAPSPLRRMG
tara:strand:+ start:229 stop:1596 length:1368 start_codon:yes stop_codon:yes gene_type:complete